MTLTVSAALAYSAAGTVTTRQLGDSVAELEVELDIAARSLATRLTIAEIETIADPRAAREDHRGSAYKMTHRSTIVTRIRTEEGIVGEAYCGDEDASLHEIDAILRTRSRRG